jgi:hypothetical protein
MKSYIILFAIPFVCIIVMVIALSGVLASPFILMGFVYFQWKKHQRIRETNNRRERLISKGIIGKNVRK